MSFPKNDLATQCKAQLEAMQGRDIKAKLEPELLLPPKNAMAGATTPIANSAMATPFR